MAIKPMWKLQLRRSVHHKQKKFKYVLIKRNSAIRFLFKNVRIVPYQLKVSSLQTVTTHLDSILSLYYNVHKLPADQVLLCSRPVVFMDLVMVLKRSQLWEIITRNLFKCRSKVCCISSVDRLCAVIITTFRMRFKPQKVQH